jgi:hypothetical protein
VDVTPGLLNRHGRQACLRGVVGDGKPNADASRQLRATKASDERSVTTASEHMIMTKLILSFATALVLLAGAADSAWARAGASGHMAFRGYRGSANGCKVHPDRARCHQEASRQEQEDRQRETSLPN